MKLLTTDTRTRQLNLLNRKSCVPTVGSTCGARPSPGNYAANGSSSSWVNLADLKESHPIEVAEYAKILGIDHEPAFNWWVPHILKMRDRITSLVKKRSPRSLMNRGA
jgi:hypothetical protein